MAAVQDEPVVGGGKKVGGDMGHELAFGFEGRLGIGGDEAEAVGDAEDVGVDRHGGLVEGNGHHHVGRFAADAGERLELVAVGGHLPLEVADELPCHGGEVAGFAVGVGDGADVGEYLLGGGGGHGRGVGESLEEGGSDKVDAFIRALGGEDDGDEEGERVAVVEFCGGGGHFLLEPGEDVLVSFLACHGRMVFLSLWLAFCISWKMLLWVPIRRWKQAVSRE